MKFPAIDRRALPKGSALSSWTALDGWLIRRLDWPQDEDADTRGSVLFFGGRGDFIEKYLEPVAYWHHRGWNVTSCEWRGQGGSRGTIRGGHLDSFDPLIGDADALVADWLASTRGPHVLIGHSMGGHLVLRLLAERKPAVDAAVLVAPMIGINATPVPPRLGRLVARGLSRLGWREVPAWKHNERPAPPGSTRQGYLTSCNERYADELWWKTQEPGYDLGPPSWGWMNAAFASIASVTPEKMRAITIPVLILGTRQDRLVSPTAIYRAARLLPHAELLMFETAAHELLRESDAVRLQALARIDTFLDERARS